jgi:hypothetical protein
VSDMQEAIERLAMAMGYVCDWGPALASAAAQKGRGNEGLGHRDERPGMYLVQIDIPNPQNVAMCRECKDLVTGPTLAEVVPDLNPVVVSGPIGEGPWPVVKEEQ